MNILMLTMRGLGAIARSAGRLTKPMSFGGLALAVPTSAEQKPGRIYA